MRANITVIRTFNRNEEKMKKAVDILTKAIINDLIEGGEIDEESKHVESNIYSSGTNYTSTYVMADGNATNRRA